MAGNTFPPMNTPSEQTVETAVDTAAKTAMDGLTPSVTPPKEVSPPATVPPAAVANEAVYKVSDPAGPAGRFKVSVPVAKGVFRFAKKAELKASEFKDHLEKFLAAEVR